MRNRKRNRLAGFDYSEEAVYFITSNCHNGIHEFGRIENQKMILNESGDIAEQQILWLTEQYPYLVIHNYVVMPNHVHLLMEIDLQNSVRMSRDSSVRCNKPSDEINQFDKIKIKSISELMGAYKTTSSKLIHRSGNLGFKWHYSFYDHIVRNRNSFYAINKYITQNPTRWKNDEFLPNY